jgi:hypothetical protein
MKIAAIDLFPVVLPLQGVLTLPRGFVAAGLATVAVRMLT